MDSWGIAVVLGIVEGLTEFIPVSSTGHLIIAGHLLGFVGEKASSFQIAIQSGAILAVVVLYRQRFAALVPVGSACATSSVSSMRGWRGLWRIALASLPALVVGYLARHVIKEHLFTPVAVTWALLAGGIAILIAEGWISRRRSNSLESLSLTQAVGIGLFQILALWPGTSRAAATIVGGMLLGLDRKGAAEFSFLIAVPVLLAATGYEIVTMQAAYDAQELTLFGIGFVVSFVVAMISVRTFVLYLGRWSLAPFGWYRIAAAPIFYILTEGLSF
ncbi:MAG: undecaprenyl-diphosphate phosphatase [Candidatus Binatia bacterium]